MIHDQDLAMFLWVEACNMTVSLQNKSPHRVVEDMTSEEAFTGVKPKASHLRIFSSPMYVHIPSKKRTKLEPSSEKGIFVGYNDIPR
jgi:hypothetical protein